VDAFGEMLVRRWPPLPYQGPFFDERDEAVVYTINDDRGQRAGECRVVYRWSTCIGDMRPEFCDVWVMSHVWIEPEFRRQGHLRRAWELLTRWYPGIQPAKRGHSLQHVPRLICRRCFWTNTTRQIEQAREGVVPGSDEQPCSLLRSDPWKASEPC
jgi:hypothetical protein